jgi:lipid-A-disaccharide synthase-like uncharacterized protein
VTEWLAGFLKETPAARAWLAVGLLGQVVFFSRWIVQIAASERHGRSTVPLAFWYLSLAGGGATLGYGLHDRDLVVVVGQAVGVVVYVRNILLLHRARHALPAVPRDVA